MPRGITIGAAALVAVAVGASVGRGLAAPAEGPARAGVPQGTVSVIREVQQQGYRVRLDLSRQVLRISAPEAVRYEGRPGTVEETLHPSLQGLLGDGFVPTALLVQKAKQFDDGLYAAVDLAAQKGTSNYSGKAVLLRELTQQLAARGTASESTLTLLLGAARLGGVVVDVPPSLLAKVNSRVAEFVSDELRSKPIAFYTWTKELSGIFQQDRMLQSDIDAKGIPPLIEVLYTNPRLRSTYEGYLTLVSKLTNPLVQEKPDLRPLLLARESGPLTTPRQDYFFFPPSAAHETELLKKLYRGGPIPEGFNLMEEMIRRIRSGELTLTPTKDSGWYDYQTWAHEPMVIPGRMPEAKHLRLDEGYQKNLLDLFRGAQALARETHIKQLEIEMATMAPPGPRRKQPPVIVIRPDLKLEPLPTYYERRAQGYRHVREAIEAVLGASALREMRRIVPEGSSPRSLEEELSEMQGLFRGARVVASREIGLSPSTAPAGADVDAERLSSWSKALPSDPDLGRDLRMMVPVFYDQDRRKTKVWLFLGWVSRPTTVDFAVAPTAEIFDATGRKLGPSDGPQLSFLEEAHDLVYPVTAEVYVGRILNREEFRKHCDTYKTRSAILAKLQ
jgi:hypothetical protein